MTQQARNIGTSRFLNKNSAYIESLVSFILDTKPYHSKLTEIIEEYQFNEKMHVNMQERLMWRNKADSHWMYNYYSSGTTINQKTKLNRLFSNLFNTTKMRVGGNDIDGLKINWDVTDIAGIPQAYSKKATSGLGVSQVKLKRDSGKILPLVQSLDWHQSLGAFQFFINQVNEGDKFNPTWQSGVWRSRGDPNDPSTEVDIIHTITARTRARALDKSNPDSNINKITAILTRLRKAVKARDKNLTQDEFVQFHEVYREIDERLAILEAGNTLPRTYETLIADINNTEKLKDIKVDEYYAELRGLTSSLFFGDFTEKSIVEGGLVYYAANIDNGILKIQNIIMDPNDSVYEDWTITCISDRTQQFNVHGSVSGFVGSFLPGERFIADKPATLEFDTTAIKPAKTGFSISISPANKVAIHPSAKMETWNIIKTNPIAYTRPVLFSKEYGHITNFNGDVNQVEFFTPDTPERTMFVLTYIGDGIFELVNPDIPDLLDHIPVNTEYRGEQLGFIIHTGSIHPYVVGDEFFIFVYNEQARLIDPGMYFGYDVDPYDNDNLGNPIKTANPRLSLVTELLGEQDPNAPATLEHIQFLFDTRFKDYEFEHDATEFSVHGRQYRATAIVDETKPIYTLYKEVAQGKRRKVSEVDGSVDLADPDPERDIQFSILDINTDPFEDQTPDLHLYYATEFEVTYSDDGFNDDIHTIPGNIKPGDTFEHDGVKFTINSVEGKPFIGVIANEYEKTFIDGKLVGHLKERVYSGDILFFEVHNPPPVLEEPAHLVAQYTPHVHMHALAYFEAPAADWVVSVGDNNAYTLTGYNGGAPIARSNGTFTLQDQGPNEGYSIDEFGVAFSIDPGYGLYPGNEFKFTTLSRKPSYLVHGSVTGFTAPAKVGEWYWNGQIGFKISEPKYMVYDENDMPFGDQNDTPITVHGLNPNHDNAIYTFKALPNVPDRLLATDDHRGIIGNVDSDGNFVDNLININIDYSKFADRKFVRLKVIETDLDLYHGHDMVILKSNHPGYIAQDGNDFWVTKTTDSALRLSIQTDPKLIEGLHPTSIPFAGYSEVQYKNSPELRLYDNWIPMFRTEQDSNTSLAKFYDPATNFVYKSAMTGELIGTVNSLDPSKLSETVYFNWDKDFFAKYLPVNSSINLLTVNQGYSEVVKTYITESVKILIRPGPYIDDVSDRDDLKATITDYAYMEITLNQNDDIKPVIEDDKLNGYLVGFGNNGYNDYDLADLTEDEKEALADLLYDEGQPIEIYSLLQKFDLTEEERKTVIDRWQIYLFDEQSNNPTEVPPVTKEQWQFFIKMMTTDPAPGKRLVDQFGIPNKGAALDITSRPSAIAATRVTDGMDQLQFFTKAGTLPSVLLPTTEIHLYTNILSQPPVFGDTWESHEALITCNRPSREVVIQMDKAESDVTAYVWVRGAANAIKVPLTYVKPNVVKFTMSMESVVKVDLVKS